MDGCWDLNRVWYQFPAIPCGVEYSGVYPLEWEWEDVQKLTEWIDDGEIWVTVMVWDRKNKNTFRIGKQAWGKGRYWYGRSISADKKQ